MHCIMAQEQTSQDCQVGVPTLKEFCQGIVSSARAGAAGTPYSGQRERHGGKLSGSKCVVWA